MTNNERLRIGWLLPEIGSLHGTSHHDEGVGRQMLDLQGVRKVDGLSVAQTPTAEQQHVVAAFPTVVLQRGHIDGSGLAAGFERESLLYAGHTRHLLHPTALDGGLGCGSARHCQNGYRTGAQTEK